MWLRLITGAGLLALGYYVGKQVGQMQPVRDELKRAREDAAGSPAPDEAEVSTDRAPE